MKYPVFLSDFDGTLVRADGTVSQTNLDAINAYLSAGGKFSVCSGRGLNSVLAQAKKMGLKEGLAVAYQGATIVDLATGKILKDEGFSRESVLRVLNVMESHNLHVQIYTVDSYLCNRDNEMLAYYERIVGIRARRVLDEPLSKTVERENLRIIKALAVVAPEDRFTLRDTLKQELGEEYYVTCSSEWLVEVMPKTQNKGTAVRFLADYYGVDVSRVAAIGDQLNDVPMILAAGGKFAVSNAESELKELARVVPSNEEDGVAVALKIAMGEEE